MQERQKELGIKGLSPKEVADNSSAIMEWLKGTGASKVVIHFDLDVLDPAEIIAGVGVDPDGMKMDEVIRVINDIAAGYDLISLTIAEPMPRHQTQKYAQPVTVTERVAGIVVFRMCSYGLSPCMHIRKTTGKKS